MFSIALMLIAGSLQHKIHGDHRGGSKYRWLCWDHQRDQWSKSTTIATSAAPWTTSTWQWPFYGRCAEGNWLGWYLWPWIPVCVCEVFHHPDKRSYGETSWWNAEKSMARCEAVSPNEHSPGPLGGPEHQHTRPQVMFATSWPCDPDYCLSIGDDILPIHTRFTKQPAFLGIPSHQPTRYTPKKTDIAAENRRNPQKGSSSDPF